MKRKLAIAMLATVAVLALAAWQGWRAYGQFVGTPLSVPADGAVVLVDSGMSGRAVVDRLADAGLTKPGWRWRLLLRLEPVVIRAGEYRIDPGMLPRDVLARMAGGDVIQYRFTIVEGWTLRQLLLALGADPRLGATLPQPVAPELLQGMADGYPNREGWFLPETYAYVRGDDYRDILHRAYEAMRGALAAAWSARPRGYPLETPYELLILASIVEKETALEAERAEIAGVFVRRLQRGMRLQTDPTVIYGLGDAFDGDLRRRDLEQDTPYNTYTRHGLPPTPIALPGRASLFAAARPAPGDALYFVADGSGGHTFSESLEEHREAVNRMLGRQP